MLYAKSITPGHPIHGASRPDRDARCEVLPASSSPAFYSCSILPTGRLSLGGFCGVSRRLSGSHWLVSWGICGVSRRSSGSHWPPLSLETFD